MGILNMIVAAILAFGIAVFTGLCKDEVTAWLPRLTNAILNNAISRLPENERDKLAEYWTSHIGNLPGKLGQIIAALGCFRGALFKEKLTEKQVEEKLAQIVIIASIAGIVMAVSDRIDIQNWYVNHLVGFANYCTMLAMMWNLYWSWKIRPYLLGESSRN